MTLSAADRMDILEVVTGRATLRAAVGPVWAAEGPATLHLTLNPVIDPGPAGDQATVRSGTWRITRRTVAPASSH